MSGDQRMIPRAHAPALRAAVDRLSNTARGSFWLVPEAICRVYVLALYDGRDPFLAIRRAWFGERLGVYEVFANRSAREWLDGLQAVPVDIPRAAA